MTTTNASEEARAREILAREYEQAEAPTGSGQRFHAANVRCIGTRDYADWKDHAALRAMLAFARTQPISVATLCGYEAGLADAKPSPDTVSGEVERMVEDAPHKVLDIASKLTIARHGAPSDHPVLFGAFFEGACAGLMTRDDALEG